MLILCGSLHSDSRLPRFNQFSKQSQSGPPSAQALPRFRVTSGARTRGTWDRAMVGRLPAAIRCLFVLLVTAAPLNVLAQDERPIPPLPIAPRQATDHARALSEMAETAARDSAKCQSSGAALGSQAYKKCRALLWSKTSIENNVPPDRSYASTRGR